MAPKQKHRGQVWPLQRIYGIGRHQASALMRAWNRDLPMAVAARTARVHKAKAEAFLSACEGYPGRVTKLPDGAPTSVLPRSVDPVTPREPGMPRVHILERPLSLELEDYGFGYEAHATYEAQQRQLRLQRIRAGIEAPSEDPDEVRAAAEGAASRAGCPVVLAPQPHMFSS